MTKKNVPDRSGNSLYEFPDENPYPVIRVSSEGIILYANKSSQVLLESWDCQVGSPAPLLLIQFVQETLASKATQQIELEVGAKVYSLTLVPILRHGYVNLYAYDISAVRAAEQEQVRLFQELESERARWQAIIESISDPVTVGNARGEAVYMNAAYRRTVQRTIQNGLEREKHADHYQIYHLDGSLFSSDQLPLQRAAINDEVIENVEVMQREPNGIEHIFLWNAAPIHDRAGRLIGSVAVGHEITEQRRLSSARDRMESALIASEREFRALFELASVGKAQMDPTSLKFLRVNQRLCEITGYTEQELLSMTFPEIIYPADREKEIETFRAVVKGDTKGWSSENRYLRKDGSMLWVETNGTMIRDESGRPIRSYAIILDISARKQLEEENLHQRELLERQNLVMEHQNALLKAIYKADPGGLAVVSGPEFRFRYVNDAYHKFIPEPNKEIEGLRFDDVWPNARVKGGLDNLQQVIETSQPLQIDQFSYKIQDGSTHFYSIIMHPLDWEGQPGVLIVIWETTAIEAARREAHQYALKLESTNRELKDFAFIASHDLQEPLRKVKAFGDRLQDRFGPALGEEGRDYIQRMQNAAERMQALLDSLLAYSRVTTQAKPFEQVDLNQILQDVISDLEVRIEQTSGKVETGQLPTLEADPQQMRQLFQNLIGNALKFHHDGIPPVVRVEAQYLSSNEVQLKVEDNGIGFDEKYMDRIFQPFQRLHTRSEYEGTGMGLAICRKITERHAGTISVHSRLGQGTTFFINLPLVQTTGMLPVSQ